MVKYSFEFKKKLVLEYLNGKGGYDFISNSFMHIWPSPRINQSRGGHIK